MPKILLLTIILTKFSNFMATYGINFDHEQGGLFIYQTVKKRAIHILSEQKKGAIRAADPHYTIYRELPPVHPTPEGKSITGSAVITQMYD